MPKSYNSSRTSSISLPCSREEPEVTLDDVAVVVAGLNNKVLQLKRDILALKDSPGSERRDERAGLHAAKDGSRKLVVRRCDDNITRRRNSKSSARRTTRLQQSGDFPRENDYPSSSTPFLSEDIPKKQRNLRRETRNNSLIDHGEFNASDGSRNGRSTSESSTRIPGNNSRNETTQTSKTKRKNKSSRENFAGHSTPDPRKDRAVSSRNGKYATANRDGRSGMRKPSMNSELSHRDQKRKSTMEQEGGKMGKPTKNFSECEGIRRALGLSNAYCSCASTGRAVRITRKKRISRGVQCNQLDDKKKKRSSSFSGCFAFKCCVARPKSSERNKSRPTNEKKEQASSEAYEPDNTMRNEKRIGKTEKNVSQRRVKINTTGNHRISGGGGEQLGPQYFQYGETLLPTYLRDVNTPQRHPRGSWRKTQAAKDTSIGKNDVADVKRRLNECMMELNAIIGDFGFIFNENEHR